MVNNICMYLNYRILGDIQSSPFEKDGKECKRVSFAASSYSPDSNGLFVKLFCYAFDSTADEILNANLKNGDIVSLFVEHKKYKSSKGIVEDRYRVVSLNYIKKERKNNSNTETENNSAKTSDFPSSPEKMVKMSEFMGFIGSSGLFS